MADGPADTRLPPSFMGQLTWADLEDSSGIDGLADRGSGLRPLSEKRNLEEGIHVPGIVASEINVDISN